MILYQCCILIHLSCDGAVCQQSNPMVQQVVSVRGVLCNRRVTTVVPQTGHSRANAGIRRNLIFFLKIQVFSVVMCLDLAFLLKLIPQLCLLLEYSYYRECLGDFHIKQLQCTFLGVALNDWMLQHLYQLLTCCWAQVKILFFNIKASTYSFFGSIFFMGTQFKNAVGAQFGLVSQHGGRRVPIFHLHCFCPQMTSGVVICMG